MTIYIIVLLAFLTHVGFAGSRLAVPLFAVDQGATPFVVGTIMALYALFPAVLALPAGRMTDHQFFMPIYGRAHGLSATAIGVVMSAFAVAIILLRIVLPFAVRRTGEVRLFTYAMFVAAAAFLLFPLLHTPWTLAAASFLLGVGCGVGQPLAMTLLFNASPRERAAEATGMRITVNQVTHFVIPLLFGAVGSVAGFTAVFLTNAGFLAAGGCASLRNQRRR